MASAKDLVLSSELVPRFRTFILGTGRESFASASSSDEISSRALSNTSSSWDMALKRSSLDRDGVGFLKDTFMELYRGERASFELGRNLDAGERASFELGRNLGAGGILG